MHRILQRNYLVIFEYFVEIVGQLWHGGLVEQSGQSCVTECCHLMNVIFQRIFMFSGKYDNVVYPGVMKKLLQQYYDLNVPAGNILSEFDIRMTSWLS